MGKTTQNLISLAHEVNPSPPQREYDMLVAVGERISASLLAMALAGRQKEAISFTGSQAGIITSECHSEACILDVRPHRLLPHLKAGKVVIIAGFQGVSHRGEITTLGRGGSDISAVAIAAVLRAEKVEFYKDVEGIYAQYPPKNIFDKPIPQLNYEEAKKIIEYTGGKILHPRSIALAAKNSLPLHVLSYFRKEDRGTLITDGLPLKEQIAYEDFF